MYLFENMRYVAERFQVVNVSGQIWTIISFIIFFYGLAWIVQRLASRVAGVVLGLNRFSGERRRWRAERLQTLRGLISSSTTFLAYALASLFTLSLFVQTDSLIWMIGLFSAAFGLSARPIISDYMTGIGFMLEDTVDVGEKVEMLGVPGGPIEGVIESMNLRVTLLRSTSGENYTIPNGEIRVIRNFSRGRFSTSKVKLKIAGSDLENALGVLEDLGEEAVSLLPNLLEPWDVISPDGEVGPQTELMIVAKSRFGQASKMRPRLLSLVQKRMADADIELVG